MDCRPLLAAHASSDAPAPDARREVEEAARKAAEKIVQQWEQDMEKVGQGGVIDGGVPGGTYGELATVGVPAAGAAQLDRLQPASYQSWDPRVARHIVRCLTTSHQVMDNLETAQMAFDDLQAMLDSGDDSFSLSQGTWRRSGWRELDDLRKCGGRGGGGVPPGAVCQLRRPGQGPQCFITRHGVERIRAQPRGLVKPLAR